jgi:hypothetical protein
MIWTQEMLQQLTEASNSLGFGKKVIPGCSMARNIKFRHDMYASCPGIPAIIHSTDIRNTRC